MSDRAKGSATPSDADDEVAAVLPIYLNVRSDSQMVLVQHPLSSVTMAQRVPQAASWRPGAKQLSVSYAVDVGERHFNPTAKDSTTGISKIEHVSTALPCQTGLAVGAIIGNALHLSPLPLALQMRPDLSHIDRKADESRRAAAASSTTKQASRVQKQARRRAEADMARHTMSISQLSDIRQIDTPFPLEPFRETSGIGPGGEEVDARVVVDELLVSCKADEDEDEDEDGGEGSGEGGRSTDPSAAPDRAVSVVRYVASLGADKPDSVLVETAAGAADQGLSQRFGYSHGSSSTDSDGYLSRSQLLKLAVTELWRVPMKQCLCELLRRAGSLPHHKIVELAVGSRPDVDTEASYAVMEELVVTELRHLARLLRGCWVARSELWLRDPSIRHDAAQALLSGKGRAQSYHVAGRLKLTRDAVLAAFHGSSVVRRSDLCSGMKLDAKAVKSVLLEVARFVPHADMAAEDLTVPASTHSSDNSSDLGIEKYGVWVWRWPESDAAVLEGSTTQEAKAEDSVYWVSQLQVATKVMRPAGAVDSSDGGESDSEGAEPPLSSSSSSSPLASPSQAPRARAAAASSSASAPQDGEGDSDAAAADAGADSDGSSQGDGALDPAAVADATIASILKTRPTTRKGDIKARARKDHGITLSEQELVAAIERAGLAKIEGSRGFYGKP